MWARSSLDKTPQWGPCPHRLFVGQGQSYTSAPGTNFSTRFQRRKSSVVLRWAPQHPLAHILFIHIVFSSKLCTCFPHKVSVSIMDACCGGPATFFTRKASSTTESPTAMLLFVQQRGGREHCGSFGQTFERAEICWCLKRLEPKMNIMKIIISTATGLGHAPTETYFEPR